MKNIVILISGSGSNMAAIVQTAQQDNWAERLDARIAAVISNRADAGGLEKAQAAGIPTAVLDHHQFSERTQFDQALAELIDRYQPALVVLAGFMRVLGAPFVKRYEGRILNIHPSLLPAFKGLHTHQRAIEAGCTMAGATVHQVTAELDDGAILEQAAVPVMPCDTAADLAARVLKVEHVIYPRAIARLLNQML
jgi:phosphoribosylglycinamide formyltransferase-1